MFIWSERTSFVLTSSNECVVVLSTRLKFRTHLIFLMHRCSNVVFVISLSAKCACIVHYYGKFHENAPFLWRTLRIQLATNNVQSRLECIFVRFAFAMLHRFIIRLLWNHDANTSQRITKFVWNEFYAGVHCARYSSNFLLIYELIIYLYKRSGSCISHTHAHTHP